MDRFLFNLVLAIDGVLMNKLRAFLTALGIIFGVAAVIAMLAIGEGAKAAILDQLKLIGSNSIVVSVKKESVSQDEADEGSGTSSDSQKEGKTKWSPGLREADVDAITAVVPTVEKISPEVIMNKKLLANNRQGDVRCVGITGDFFVLNNIPMGAGHDFASFHHESGAPVCIIGRNIQKNYFQQRDLTKDTAPRSLRMFPPSSRKGSRTASPSTCRSDVVCIANFIRMPEGQATA